MKARSLLQFLACCTLFVGALGCNQIAGINEPLSPDGGSTGGSAADIDRFVGSWKTAGKITLTCPNSDPVTADTTNAVTLARGTSSDLVATDTSCSLALNVSGSTATFTPNQTCIIHATYSGPPVQAETDAYKIESGTFVLDADGNSGTVTLDGTVEVTIGNNSPIDCGYHRVDPYLRN